MNCEETQSLIHAYMDAELDLVRSLELERHLRDCPVCSTGHENIQVLRGAVRELYYQPPAHLQKRIMSALRKEARSSHMNIGAEHKFSLWSWRPFYVAASLAFIAILSWSAIRLLSIRSENDLLAREVIASHVRSLMAEHLADVMSSDRHTVKPWFNGKLDFSPPVQDLAEEGFPLVGGRLDYVGNRPVAALVYQRRQHYINLFVWPSTGGTAGSSELSTQGYNVVRWNSPGMTVWIVSDLNKRELQDFSELMRSRFANEN
ncbi:MAG TPA: anti-sigma factor [Blastocatellia bacterium]|nr:anti-sigma factor [Blastocatellia bacterium]